MKHQQHYEPSGTQMLHLIGLLKLNVFKELKATLLASLQVKVATLDEDKWMFEKDDSPPQ